MTAILQQQLTQCHDCFSSLFCFCVYTSTVTKSHTFCEEQTGNVCVRCTGCSYCNLELAFLLDSSTKSIGDAWTRILEYTNSVIAGYNIGPNCVRVAVISYSDNAVVSIELNRYNDINSLQQAVRQLPLLNGGSNLANAFNLLRTRVFVPNVIRPNTALIAVVVTDQIQPSQQLTNEANSVKGQGITIIAVGITRVPGRVDTDTLFGVSTNNYAVSVSDYNQLSGVVSSVTQRWGCFPVPTTPPPPVTGKY